MQDHPEEFRPLKGKMAGNLNFPFSNATIKERKTYRSSFGLVEKSKQTMRRKWKFCWDNTRINRIYCTIKALCCSCDCKWSSLTIENQTTETERILTLEEVTHCSLIHYRRLSFCVEEDLEQDILFTFKRKSSETKIEHEDEEYFYSANILDDRDDLPVFLSKESRDSLGDSNLSQIPEEIKIIRANNTYESLNKCSSPTLIPKESKELVDNNMSPRSSQEWTTSTWEEPPDFLFDLNSFSYLPHEILFHIFTFLSSEDLAHTSQVCREWNLVSNDRNLWRQFCILRWPFLQTPLHSWKETYLKRVRQERDQQFLLHSRKYSKRTNPTSISFYPSSPLKDITNTFPSPTKLFEPVVKPPRIEKRKSKRRKSNPPPSPGTFKMIQSQKEYFSELDSEPLSFADV